MNFSSGEGTGTAFHVTLPFAIDPTPTAVADNTADSIDLTGMQMPVMNVYKATRVIRQTSGSDAKTTPILAMSANAFQDDVQKSRAVGMNAHLPKPLSTENLLGAIARYITQK